MQPATPPSIDQIWSWLDEVPDPEIPVISLLDLGIVRDVDLKGQTAIITITPTYSGCPAARVIALDIETALINKGVPQVEIKTVLAPAWTTDWITDTGKQKLRDYGIAPPEGGAPCAGLIAKGPVTCPLCGSADTERVSAFGSTPCKASYRCLTCLEPFDYFKPF